MVWLDTKNIQIKQPSVKLGPKQLGPYKVIEWIRDLDYWLKLPSALKVHNVFHIDQLFLYISNEQNGLRLPPPELVEVDSKEEYEVKEVLDSWICQRCLEYLVWWKGHSEGEDSWEPATNLGNVQESV